MSLGRKKLILPFLLAILLPFTAGAGSAEEGDGSAHEAGSWVRKGTSSAGFWIGPAYGTTAVRSSQQHDLILAAGSYGRVLTGLRAPRKWYRGYLELVGEVAVGRQREPSHASLVGVTLLARRDFAAGRRWLPFVQAGLGLTYTDIRDGDLSTDLELNLQIGGGAQLRLGRGLALSLQFRWLHLSNAGVETPNLGVDAHVLATGLTWFF